MPIRVALLFILTVTFSCGSERPYPDAGPIYVAALSELAPAVTHYTIQVEKIARVERIEPGESMESLDLSVIRDYGTFVFPDLEGRLTERDFPGLKPTLIDGDDLARLDSPDCEAFWRNFRIKYAPSTGYIRLSEIGFNEARTEAVFYLSGTGGCLAGSGTLVLMKRVNDRWVVAGRREVWVA